ncbi:MAG: AbrB/MazE/SpoVT family DNA-binding domain-containing protein [Acidobacteriota bacterium]
MRTTVVGEGQVTIPAPLREALHIHEGDELDVALDGERIVLSRAARRGQMKDWRRWEGLLEGSGAVEEHLREHREEIEREGLL